MDTLHDSPFFLNLFTQTQKVKGYQDQLVPAKALRAQITDFRHRFATDAKRQKRAREDEAASAASAAAATADSGLLGGEGSGQAHAGTDAELDLGHSESTAADAWGGGK